MAFKLALCKEGPHEISKASESERYSLGTGQMRLQAFICSDGNGPGKIVFLHNE